MKQILEEIGQEYRISVSEKFKNFHNGCFYIREEIECQKSNDSFQEKNKIPEKIQPKLNSDPKQKKNKIKKYNLNILYYDENLKDYEENCDNCFFIEMNTNGTFYGCDNIELFKIVCEKIKQNKKKFILISSGSAAKKIYDHCINFREIKECIIYCYQKEKYLPLMKQYSKLKGVYNIISDLQKKLYKIQEKKIENISSSNLIFFEDYSKQYIKLHYEFIKKYSLYKIAILYKFDETHFLNFVEKNFPDFLDTAKELFPNKNEIIEFFLKKFNESPKTVNEIFQNDDNIKTYIQNYSYEDFYYKYLNKFLREGNFETFRILLSYLAKFIYKLYDYREKNLPNKNDSNLYRKMFLNPNDIKLYAQSIEKVICFPSFTLTSIKKNGFIPSKNNYKDELVLFIINQNDSKSSVLISQFSNFPEDEEFLFLPFSFFKIQKVELKKGSVTDPHLIHLLALNTDKSIEEMFLNFFDNETDNLNPEGLDLLILSENKTKIIFNPIYLSNNKH